MSIATESVSQASFRQTLDECIQHARANGVGDFSLGKRSQPRLPYVHPVRYCLDWAGSESEFRPGYTLTISLGGMALCSQVALPVGKAVRVCLPLSDGSSTWLEGTIAHCEPDAEHYRAGIAFAADDDQVVSGSEAN